MHYRKIWERHHGLKLSPDIEIHHKDGNRNNNHISNLQAVTIEEHFNIHKTQGDYAAAAFIAERLLIPVSEYIELKKKAGIKCYEDKIGFHKHTSEEKAFNGSKGGKKVRDEKLGIFSDNYDRKLNGIKCRDRKIGFHGMSKEDRVRISSEATKNRIWIINKEGKRKRVLPEKLEEMQKLGFKKGMAYE